MSVLFHKDNCQSASARSNHESLSGHSVAFGQPTADAVTKEGRKGNCHIRLIDCLCISLLIPWFLFANSSVEVFSSASMRRSEMSSFQRFSNRSTVTTTMTTRTTTTTTLVTTTTTTLTWPLGLFKLPSDGRYFERWLLKEHYESLGRNPKVLIFCWVTEDVMLKFVNAIYWMSCYAHSHGFDIAFDSSLNFTGVKEYEAKDYHGKWYSQKTMWGTVAALPKYLFSGVWDYVFWVAVDSLPNGNNFGFPVWAYDAGHDITVMDLPDNHWALGLNFNAVLFRPTNFTRWFLEELFEFRKDFYLQHDNGPFMEMVLRTLGQESQEKGLGAYKDECLDALRLPMPTGYFLKYKVEEAERRMEVYSWCFLNKLNALAGHAQHRKSKHIGFTATQLSVGNQVFQYKDRPLQLKPWANCYHLIRYDPEASPWANCMFFHFNGYKGGQFDRIRGGRCDATFPWNTWKYNPAPDVDLFVNEIVDVAPPWKNFTGNE